MGMFKEQAYEFEQLHRKMPPLGYRTNITEHQPFLARLRDWYKDMADMKFARNVVGNTCTDKFFIAWDRDDGIYSGTLFMVQTIVKNDGSKEIVLDGSPMTMSYSDFSRYFRR